MTVGDEMNDQDQGPTVVEFAISAELAAVPAVRTALDRRSVVLAEAEMLDDNDVSGFAMGAGQTIEFSGSTIQPPGPDAAGCIGFGYHTGCGIFWKSCLSKGWI